MVVLSLDTTTRAGSAALWRDGRVLAEREGDRTRTHGQRLPRELFDLLAAHRTRVSDVDLFAVAAGPGSFTGLRVGIATMQGLAFANGRPIVGVSTLDALARAGARARRNPELRNVLIAAWMDAQRDEVYSALYEADGITVVEPAAVDSPARTLERWVQTRLEPRPTHVAGSTNVDFIGDGAVRYRDVVEKTLGGRAIGIRDAPPLAGLIAQIAVERAGAGEARPPHAVRPIYVRRPDAELARDRKTSAP